MSTTPIIRSYEAKVDDVKPAERAVISRIGGMDVDRHRTIISHRGIDLSSYKKNPIVLHEHGKCPTRGSLPVGKNQWIKIDGDKMIAKTIFRDDPYSIELFNAYKDDWMRGWSINVISHEAGPPSDEEIRATPNLRNDCDLIYRRTELIEYSTTSAPSHRDALTILVERGIWVPDEALAEAAARTSTSVAMPGLPAPEPDAPESESRTMTESVGGMAGGGAAVKPEVRDKDDDDEEDEEEGESDEPEKTDEPEEPNPKGKPREQPRTIRKRGNKYVIYSEAGKTLGEYATREEAEKRLQQIEYFKHQDAADRSTLPPAHDPDDPVQPDGSGGWTARGFPGMTFPSRDVALEAIRAVAVPCVSPADVLLRYDREIAERNATILGVVAATMEEERAKFELREFGVV